ncbi:MAG: response regulator [Bacteroidota bacterium]|nr:response regulator [Bacteroidota bacterium]
MKTKISKKKHQTLFLIDDEDIWLETMQTVLDGESYNVITADSGIKALDKLAKVKPDLILSDVRMPVMNGFELYDKIKNNPKLNTIPFVFMSSLDDYDARRVAKSLGATDYVTKPFDTEEIKRVVLDLLQKYKNR